jgi:hypothetical protein
MTGRIDVALIAAATTTNSVSMDSKILNVLNLWRNVPLTAHVERFDNNTIVHKRRRRIVFAFNRLVVATPTAICENSQDKC